MGIPQRLYESEINGSISWFWDGGFRVQLGDEQNGFIDEATVETWAQAETWLDEAARRHYPHSTQARRPS